MRQLILISDVSRQFAQLTARRVRERDVFCEVVEPGTLAGSIKEKKPVGIILTGDESDAKLITDEIKSSLRDANVPVLAIGAAAKALNDADFPMMMMSCSPTLAGEEAKAEVAGFLFDSCKCAGDWTASAFAKESIDKLKEELKGKKVICAFSGGVDSTVAAVMVHKAIKDDLICVFVDTGMMRKNEGDQIVETMKSEFDIHLIRVDAEERFLGRLKGVTDPEMKRKIIGEEFIEVFTEEAKKHGDIDFLLQGTIYPDVLESGLDGAKSIKSHHNVGGLPERMSFSLIEPLRLLFKDEVRRVGTALGIPDAIVNRQPFPGPGLSVRCLGEVTKQRLDLLRECDAILREEIGASSLAKEIWQYFTVLPNLQSVGVLDGARTYCETIAIRAVHSIDAMTAQYVKIPYDILDRITERITNEVPQVNRVVLDITGKPPSTIEWE